jgi:hypothetical protein
MLRLLTGLRETNSEHSGLTLTGFKPFSLPLNKRIWHVLAQQGFLHKYEIKTKFINLSMAY